ncbi:MAG TPA: 2,3-diaminopropionate biosynthesis protein SbnB [Pyrinomonadaceae bacterium]
MDDGDILILNGHEVSELLAGRELELMQTVRNAYETHQAGQSSLPHSTFLRFPDSDLNRIIALPAYLGGDFEVAGMKWISSFPDNLNLGLERASAVMILNSALTGRPETILEGSLISAKRTAASAVLAAKTLSVGRGISTVGLIGTGFINFEVVRFLVASCAELRELRVFDLDADRATQFQNKCYDTFDGVKVELVRDIKDAFRNTPLVSLATTAGTPHIDDLSYCAPGTTILHVSLRDLSPEVILACDNIVDDVDHVCRASTSVHLAEQLVGNRDFIRCSLAEILLGHAGVRRDEESVAVFSPFGLGVLDLAVGALARDLAIANRMGTQLHSFIRETWIGEREAKRACA